MNSDLILMYVVASDIMYSVNSETMYFVARDTMYSVVQYLVLAHFGLANLCLKPRRKGRGVEERFLVSCTDLEMWKKGYFFMSTP